MTTKYAIGLAMLFVPLFVVIFLPMFMDREDGWKITLGLAGILAWACIMSWLLN
jgi:predicted branched-subunit amino acid permease